MNNLNNPLKLSDIIDRCLLRMAQSVNSFLDADNAMRSRLTSVIGFVITLYTLHNVEVRLRLLSVYARPLYTIAALSVLFFVAYMLLFRFAGASQINGWTSLKRTFTTQNLLFLIVCFVFAFVIYNQLFKNRKHISKTTTSFDTINLSNSTTTLNQSAIINKTIEQNAIGFNSTVFMSMISAIYHRLQKQSSCKPVEFLDLVNNYARCKNDDQDLSITSRIEAEKLFGYLSSFRSTVDEEKKLVVKNDSSESILSNLLNNLSKSSEWAQEQQREKLNQLNSHPTASISFPNLLDFWKFMIKIFLTTVILLIVTYLIIRVLLWLIENVLRPNGNGEKGSSRRTG